MSCLSGGALARPNLMPHETGKEAMGIHEFGMWRITIRWDWITAEPLSGIAHQGVKVNVLDRLSMTFMLAVHATPPPGLAHPDPVGSPVAGATKTRHIHQGFQQHGMTPEVLLPVSRHLPCTQRQDLAGESFDVHPRQNQESTVVDDLLQVPLSLCLAPADPRIPSPHLPGRRVPEQTGQLPIATTHPVAQVRTEEYATAEIV